MKSLSFQPLVEGLHHFSFNPSGEAAANFIYCVKAGQLIMRVTTLSTTTLGNQQPTLRKTTLDIMSLVEKLSATKFNFGVLLFGKVSFMPSVAFLIFVLLI
jgi:hypothetical protein